MKSFLAALAGALVLPSAVAAADLSVEARIERAMFGEHRSEANIDRNRYRHPVGTLTFFGLEDGMRVLEIWPGGGWYTEILAPVMRGHGQLDVAGYDVSIEGQPGYRYRQQEAMEKRFADEAEIFGEVGIVPFSPPEAASLGAADTYDLIVTFRNVHGWIGGGLAGDIFREFARVLKPGGVLGVVQHRAPEGADPAESVKGGYVPEAAVIALAEEAGLVLDGRSEVNANPRDTHDHPEGVWTLPPSLRLGDEDREKYLAIGESDRMTLRFRKPGG